MPDWDRVDASRADSSQRNEFSPDFIAGPENELAVAALRQLLLGDEPTNDDALGAQTELFNPLVLIGPSGAGKSHLARGIARHWQSERQSEAERHADSKRQASYVQTNGDATATEYLAAIDFARQLRTAREENGLDEFRARLAGLQLLILEDLQRLPLSVYVQRELRDTLDVLVGTGARVVITSQQHPASMVGIEAGLRDRLASGLTVRLQYPGVEARRELLRMNATARGIQVGDEQLRQLAAKIEGPVPQLFRALAQHEISATQSALSGVSYSSAMHPPLPLKQIIAVVARYFGLTQAALRSATRRKSLVYARAVVIHLARSLTDLSFAQIGANLGRRDHSTVMHAARTIEQRLASDAATQHDIEELKRILTAA